MLQYLEDVKGYLYDMFIQPFNDLIRFLNQYIDTLTLVYILLLLLGACLITLAVLLQKEDKKKNVLQSFIKDKRVTNDAIDRILDSISYVHKFETHIQRKINILDKDITPRKITKRMLMSVLLCIIFGIYIKNSLAIIPLILIGYNLPMVMLDIQIKKKRRLLEEQLGDAIKMFVTEFTTNKSFIVALNNIMKDVKAPLKHEFARLLRKLNSGEPYAECLMDFAYRLDNKWAYIFAKLIINYLDKGVDFVDHLIRVTEAITEEKIKYKENATELTAMKTTNLVLNAAIPVVYVVNTQINKEQSRVFTDTPTGRIIMLCVIVGTFISLMLGLKLENR